MLMEVDWTHFAVVGGWMMFCEVITFVVFAGLPINSKLPLSNAIAHPVKAHVNGFGAALLDSAIGNAGGTGVVCLNWSWWLGMAHVGQSGAQPGRIFSIVE